MKLVGWGVPVPSRAEPSCARPEGNQAGRPKTRWAEPGKLSQAELGQAEPARSERSQDRSGNIIEIFRPRRLTFSPKKGCDFGKLRFCLLGATTLATVQGQPDQAEPEPR